MPASCCCRFSRVGLDRQEVGELLLGLLRADRRRRATAPAKRVSRSASALLGPVALTSMNPSPPTWLAEIAARGLVEGEVELRGLDRVAHDAGRVGVLGPRLGEVGRGVRQRLATGGLATRNDAQQLLGLVLLGLHRARGEDQDRDADGDEKDPQPILCNDAKVRGQIHEGVHDRWSEVRAPGTVGSAARWRLLFPRSPAADRGTRSTPGGRWGPPCVISGTTGSPSRACSSSASSCSRSPWSSAGCRGSPRSRSSFPRRWPSTSGRSVAS